MTARAADPGIALLRHLLATLAYRLGRTLDGAPAGFERFEAGSGARTPAALVHHLANLLDFARSIAVDGPRERPAPGALAAERARFHAGLRALDTVLLESPPPARERERMLQGPLSDALTHVGQLAMLRRLAGSPVAGENFSVAPVEAGRLGPDSRADADR